MVGSRRLLRDSPRPLLLRIACTPIRFGRSTGEPAQMSAARRSKGGYSPMILYGSSLSPFVRKVLAYSAEKGLELELQPTGFPKHSAEYLEASPFRKMPAF